MTVGRPFKKGQTGNPRGRPKRSEEFRVACNRIVDESVVPQLEAEVKKHGKHWVEAAKLLLLYGKGRPITESRPLGLPLEPKTVDAEVVKPPASALESTPSEELESQLAVIDGLGPKPSESH